MPEGIPQRPERPPAGGDSPIVAHFGALQLSDPPSGEQGTFSHTHRNLTIDCPDAHNYWRIVYNAEVPPGRLWAIARDCLRTGSRSGLTVWELEDIAVRMHVRRIILYLQ